MKLFGIIIVGFEINRPTTDKIFCVHQILEERWEYNETVHQPFLNFKKAYLFSEEGCMVQLSNKVWSAHEIIQAD
jgi:hypothetical protein